MWFSKWNVLSISGRILNAILQNFYYALTFSHSRIHKLELFDYHLHSTTMHVCGVLELHCMYIWQKQCFFLINVYAFSVCLFSFCAHHSLQQGLKHAICKSSNTCDDKQIFFYMSSAPHMAVANFQFYPIILYTHMQIFAG